jgi:hypothetical protein
MITHFPIREKGFAMAITQRRLDFGSGYVSHHPDCLKRLMDYASDKYVFTLEEKRGYKALALSSDPTGLCTDLFWLSVSVLSMEGYAPKKEDISSLVSKGAVLEIPFIDDSEKSNYYPSDDEDGQGDYGKKVYVIVDWFCCFPVSPSIEERISSERKYSMLQLVENTWSFKETASKITEENEEKQKCNKITERDDERDVMRKTLRSSICDDERDVMKERACSARSCSSRNLTDDGSTEPETDKPKRHRGNFLTMTVLNTKWCSEDSRDRFLYDDLWYKLVTKFGEEVVIQQVKYFVATTMYQMSDGSWIANEDNGIKNRFLYISKALWHNCQTYVKSHKS